MVYTIFLGKQGNKVYTISPERRVYTIEPQTSKNKKKKGGFPRWWCILLSSLEPPHQSQDQNLAENKVQI